MNDYEWPANRDEMVLGGYWTCSPCAIGQHERCNGESHLHHVGGAVEDVTCACICGSASITPTSSEETP